MALQTFKTFSEKSGIKEATLTTWFNRELEKIGRKKNMEFDFVHKFGRVIHFVIIDGKKFINH